MEILEFVADNWQQAPLLAILALAGWVYKLQSGNTKTKESYSVNLTAISYTAISFEQKRHNAEQDYVARASNDAEELIEELTVEMVCDYRDDISPHVIGDDLHPKGALVRLYMGEYEKVVRKGFVRAMRDIVTMIKYNGLTSRSIAAFEAHYADRGVAIFHVVSSIMKREYDNTIMPVSIDDRLRRFDVDRFKRLSLDVFTRAREHRTVFEDRVSTLEREEQEKLTEISNRG